MSESYRIESDTMGELRVPADALWGAQTQRAVENFPISGRRMPARFIQALGLIKACAAQVNGELKLLPQAVSEAIQAAASRVAAGELDAHFPVDVFQTGSGTSSNMNVNEVIAHLASQDTGLDVHPNDHVNLGQSSNDVIPTAIHVSACLAVTEHLLPGLRHLHATLLAKCAEVAGIVKTGRTHLMDAMPLRLDQELGGWASQMQQDIVRIEHALQGMRRLAQGGTAVGTGVNAHPEFGPRFARELSARTGCDMQPSDDYFESISSQDAVAALSGQLKALAVGLMKISNDLRWMNSGPLAGIAEIRLPALQPGSSIMPGKINPVIPESVAMVSAQVIGNDLTITLAAQSGNFQLNVMLPVIACNLLDSIDILANGVRVLADKAIAGFEVQRDTVAERVHKNPILVTALNPLIGYERSAAIAKRAYAENRPVLDVAAEMTDLSRDELRELLDPSKLT